MRRKHDLHLIFYTLYKKTSSARHKMLWIALESYCIEGVSSWWEERITEYRTSYSKSDDESVVKVLQQF